MGGTYTFNVASDATVDVREPDANFGSTTRLTVDGSPERRAYLRFSVSGLEGQRVKRATLRLYATDPSADGPEVYATSDDWAFNTLTWNNAPPVRGPALADVGAVFDDAFTEWDVTAWVRGTGTYSLVLVSHTDDGVVFLSDNGAGPDKDPQLVVETEPCAEPRKAVLDPELDATVAEAAPDTSAAGSNLLVSDGSPRQETYLFFRVGNVDRPIRNARLRLHVRDGSWDGPALYRTAASWTGGDVTWNTRPGLDGAPLADLGEVRTGTWVELDVSGTVTGPGTYGFALVPTSGDGTDFTSHEGAYGYLPELVLAFDEPSCAYVGDGIGGTVSWPGLVGGKGDEELRALAADGSGGFVVAARFASRGSLNRAELGAGLLPDGRGLALARYRGDGTTVWSRGFTSEGNVWPDAVTVAADGTLLVTGTYDGALNLGAGALPMAAPGGRNLFLARFSSNGQLLWSRGFAASRGEAPGRVVPTGVAVDSRGDVVVTGGFVGLLNLGGGVLASGPGASGTAEAPDGMFLARFRADGSHRWSKAFPSGVTGATRGEALFVASDNSVLVGGVLAGGTNLGSGTATGPGLFVARFSDAGALVWSRVLTGATGVVSGVVVSGDRVFFSGHFEGAFSFGGRTYTQVANGDFYRPGFDTLLGALSLGGGDVWLRHLGTSSLEWSHALAVGPDGQVVLVGTLTRPTDVGPVTLGTGGRYVGAFSPDGDVRWVRSFGAAQLEEAIVLSTGEVLAGTSFSGPLTVDGNLFQSMNGSEDLLLLKLRP